MENIDPASLLAHGSQKPTKIAGPAAEGLLSIEHLPREVLVRIVSKLANNLAALKSLCVTSRGFADVFRDAHLWSSLIFERWAFAPRFGEQRHRPLLSLRREFAKSVSREVLLLWGSHAKIDKVCRGQYQLLLHKETNNCTSNSTFHIVVDVTEPSPQEKLRSSFYEPLYDDAATIATNSFPIQHDDTTILIVFTSLPVGLKSVQLRKLHPGQLAVVSPQWVKITRSVDFPPWDTCAGSEQDGDALWVSLRLGATHAELGRMGPGTSFLYGRHNSYREEAAPHAIFQGRAVYPAVLANIDQYEWVTRQYTDVQSLKSRAVPMGMSSDGSLHAARVLFRGWEEHNLLQHDLHVMKLSGPVLSVLPGKLEFVDDGRVRSMFTWKGKATGGSAVRLNDLQEIQVLCYKFWGGSAAECS